jgi:hypothetical protein
MERKAKTSSLSSLVKAKGLSSPQEKVKDYYQSTSDNDSIKNEGFNFSVHFYFLFDSQWSNYTIIGGNGKHYVQFPPVYWVKP